MSETRPERRLALSSTIWHARFLSRPFPQVLAFLKPPREALLLVPAVPAVPIVPCRRSCHVPCAPHASPPSRLPSCSLLPSYHFRCPCFACASRGLSLCSRSCWTSRSECASPQPHSLSSCPFTQTSLVRRWTLTSSFPINLALHGSRRQPCCPKGPVTPSSGVN